MDIKLQLISMEILDDGKIRLNFHHTAQGADLGVEGDALSCGLARLHGFIGGKPIQVTVSHGPGIEPCRCSGNTVLDA